MRQKSKCLTFQLLTELVPLPFGRLSPSKVNTLVVQEILFSCWLSCNSTARAARMFVVCWLSLAVNWDWLLPARACTRPGYLEQWSGGAVTRRMFVRLRCVAIGTSCWLNVAVVYQAQRSQLKHRYCRSRPLLFVISKEGVGNSWKVLNAILGHRY